MDLSFTSEELAFREEVRVFFRHALPPEIRAKVVLGQRLSKEELKRWTQILYAKGWATPAWSRAWAATAPRRGRRAPRAGA